MARVEERVHVEALLILGVRVALHEQTQERLVTGTGREGLVRLTGADGAKCASVGNAESATVTRLDTEADPSAAPGSAENDQADASE